LQLTGGNVLPQTAAQGDTVLISTQWQTLAPVDKNYSVSAVLLAPDGSVLTHRETYPGLGLRPTSYLNPGNTFVDSYPLELTVSISRPVVARAVVSLFDFNSNARAGFPALNTQGSEVTPVVGQLKIIPKPWPQYQPAHATNINFANAIKLFGYDLSEVENKGNPTNSSNSTNSKPYQLNLYWESLAPVNEDYNLFIHLLDKDGNVVAQADAPVTNNTYPTRWWSPGETIADTHTLPNAPAATRIHFGLYSLATGNRLPITKSDLPVQDNGVELNIVKGEE
jgi:hypothetical protein